MLDEVSASVDVQTDQLIQNIIQTEFRDSTVITIAHRLNTIINYDKILVLAHGQIAQYDSPQHLLQFPGIFREMAKAASLL